MVEFLFPQLQYLKYYIKPKKKNPNERPTGVDQPTQSSTCRQFGFSFKSVPLANIKVGGKKYPCGCCFIFLFFLFLFYKQTQIFTNGMGNGNFRKIRAHPLKTLLYLLLLLLLLLLLQLLELKLDALGESYINVRR